MGIKRFLVFLTGLTIIANGKQYKDTAYRLLRLDSELIVLPTKYANELKNLPASKLSALDATFTVRAPQADR